MEIIIFNFLFKRTAKMSQEVSAKTDPKCDSKGRNIVTKKVIYITGKFIRSFNRNGNDRQKNKLKHHQGKH